nr:V-type proton ATPase subunit G 3-like [Meriones unguiculatus]
MTSQSQGIQQLLQAEKRAKDKLEEAKKKVDTIEQETIKPLDNYQKHIEAGVNTVEDLAQEVQIEKLMEKPGGIIVPWCKADDGFTAQDYKLQFKIMGSQSHLSDEIEEQTVEKIKELNGSYNRCMESVLKQLLSMVCELKPEVHVNYRATN